MDKKQAVGTKRWTPSPPGVFKVNVDGATSEDGYLLCSVDTGRIL